MKSVKSIKKRLTPSNYLISHGWRCIGQQRNHLGWTSFWSHPEHQSDTRGAFTTTAAFAHQKHFNKFGCDCIRPEVE